MANFGAVLGCCAAVSLGLGCSTPAAAPATPADSVAAADASDAGLGDAPVSDTGSPDTATADTLAPDTAAGDAVSADAADVPAAKVFAAVPGARCAPAQRIGLVTVYAQAGSPGTLDTSASIYDSADPRIPKAAKLSDAACSYYEQPAIPPCGPCSPGKLCDPSGSCAAMPVSAPDIQLVLKGGGNEQTFVAKDANGAYGTVTLPGKSFAVAVQWSGLTVTLGETSVPPELPGAKGKLEGGYDKPSGLDLTWSPPTDAATVFTHIPINHHAGGQTFTECAAPAAAGTLHVDGPMLLPLSLITGLEFQGIEHVRFAAAETPLGCVEIRLQTLQFVDMGY